MRKDRSAAPRGPSQRQLQVGELIRRALAQILMRGDVADPALDGVSITVSEVRASPDLKNATAFVMPLGGVRETEILEALRRNRGALRKLTSRAVKLKFSPDLSFELDPAFDKMDETRRLLNEPAVRRDLHGGPNASEHNADARPSGAAD